MNSIDEMTNKELFALYNTAGTFQGKWVTEVRRAETDDGKQKNIFTLSTGKKLVREITKDDALNNEPMAPAFLVP